MWVRTALYLAATVIGWVGGARTMSEAVQDLGALRALREVDSGSIAAAATVLGVSQQALSRRCDTERTMKVTCCVRSPGGSCLTDRDAFIICRLGERTFSTPPTGLMPGCGRSGPAYRIGWRSPPARPSPSTSCRALASQLRGIEQASAEQAPGHTPTVVELTVANSTRVIELVRDVNVRLGFIETRTCQLTWSRRTCATTRCSWSPRRAIRGRAARRPLVLAEIAATPMVMREDGSGTRVTLTDHLAAEHPPLSARIAMELGTQPTGRPRRSRARQAGRHRRSPGRR